MRKRGTVDIYEPKAWGLQQEEIEKMGDRLQNFWERYKLCFKTKTRDITRHAMM